MRGQLAIKTESDQQPSTSANQTIPTEIRESLRYVQKRFLFNIEQIEKRYKSNSSGLVFNLKNDDVEFDPDECTAKNDEDLLNTVKKELHKHTLDSYGGTALLSTPAEDPDENDKTRIENWEKLNKLYDVFLRSSIEEKVKSKTEKFITFRKPLLPRKRGFTYESAYQNNPVNLKREYEEIQPPIARYSSALFPIADKNGSIAESHAMDEPAILPLLPTFRTPRQYKVKPIENYESPMTRLKKQMLAIEQNYDKRADIIYAENADWVERWINDTSAQAEDLDPGLI